MSLLRLLLAVLTLLPSLVSSLPAYPRVETRNVVAGLDEPVRLLAGGDGMLWLLERGGRVSRIDPGSGRRRTVLQIPALMIESGGAYGMTIDRDFSDSSFLYLYYPTADERGFARGQISRFRYDREADSLVDRRDIMTGLFTVEWAVGGGMVMLPDRTLLFGTGDGVDHFADAQSHRSMAGKVFRIGADGSIPSDNPWAGAPFPANMLWTTGLSNLSSITSGPRNLLYATDRGNGRLSDEVNVVMKGRNYGWWPVRGFCDSGDEEELCRDSNVVEPLYEFYRGRGGRVVPNGIAWYGGERIPEWQGSLLIATDEDGLWQLVLRDDGRGIEGAYHYFYATDDLDAYGRFRDVAVDPQGRIFALVEERNGTGEGRVIELLSVDFTPYTDGVAEITTGEIAGGLVAPQALLWDRWNHLWTAERNGRISRIDPVSSRISPVLDLSRLIEETDGGGVRGLLLHPSFPDSSFFFVSYVASTGGEGRELRLVRYVWDSASGRAIGDPVVLLDRIAAAGSRNGGRLTIDRQGAILMVTGDGGVADRASDRMSLNGKVLRLLPDGSVPPDNPRAGEERPAGFIWARGFRNPGGVVLSDAGELYGVTTGQNGGELELLRPGRDFGWPAVDGYCDNFPFDEEDEACRELELTEPLREWLGSGRLNGVAWYGSSSIPLWNNSLLVTTGGDRGMLQVRMRSDGRLVETENRYLERLGPLGAVAVSPEGVVVVATAATGVAEPGVDRILRLDAVPDITLGDESSLEVRTVVEGLDTPWEVVWGPDRWLWVTERRGVISRVDPDGGERREILDLTSTVFEVAGSGMLGMALDPDFEENPYLYIVYTYRIDPESSDLAMYERLERYTWDRLNDTLVDPTVLIDSIVATIYHDGSRVMVLPDRTIMMTTGDAADRSLPQDHTSLNGKVLRIALDGMIPEDNPWSDAPWPTCLLWSTGHRNAQGLARGPDGTIYLSEHGDDTDDELNIVLKGRNYGYPNVHGYCDDTTFFRYDPAEGRFCIDSNVVEPIRSWTPTLGVCGLAWYGHDTIPAWNNSLLMVTLGIKKPVLPLYANALIQMKMSRDGRRIVEEKHYFLQRFGRLRAVCVAPDGRVFLASSNEDTRGEPRPGGDRIVEIRPKQIASVREVRGEEWLRVDLR